MYLINTFMIFINIHVGLSFSQANVAQLAIATPGFLSRPKARSYDMFWINDLIRKSLQVYFYTPVSDVLGVIVLTSSVCVCVSPRTSFSLSRQNRRTYRREFWHGGKVEGYLC